jgi:hypothetical protein
LVSEQGRFAVLMPGKPARQSREIALAGNATRMDMLSVQVSGMAFGVGSADLPAEADVGRIVSEGRDALLRNITGKLIAERPIEIAGARGIEFEAEGATQDVRMRLAARVMVGGTRFYQVVFIGREERAATVDTGLFLRSFRLLS